MSALLAGIVTYFLLDLMENIVPYALAVAAASFLYIALADLIPEMHKETKAKESIIQFLLILLGVGIIFIAVASHSHAH
jgi:zinc and cadmium transporter